MRKSMLVLVLIWGGVVGTAPAKAKKAPAVSKMFCQAHFVYVETAGGDVLDPNTLPADRDAASALYDHLQAWKRYTLVERAEQADLVWVVRRGRSGGVGVDTGYPTGNSSATGQIGGRPAPGGSGIGPAPGGTPNLGTNREDPADSSRTAGGGGTPGGVAAQTGDPKDLLTVFMGPAEGTPQHTWLWRKAEKDGLLDPNMPLFQQIRSAVDAQCNNAGGKSN
ncbi:MAG: hypothetical protein WB524_04860 [Acidobacteriaceae bacterium]